jgi:hypothetical protein
MHKPWTSEEPSFPVELAWRIRSFFLPERETGPLWALVGRALLLVVITAYGWWFHRATMAELGESPKFIHLINLPFHEAGHVIFGLFGGDFIRVLGGTLGQLLMPLVLAVAFRWKYGDAFAGALALWWLGQNLVDCAPYINDARSLQLTLIGGSTGQEVEGHDWEYLLTQLGWINRDVHISRWVLRGGRWVMALSLLWATVVLVTQFWSRFAEPD